MGSKVGPIGGENAYFRAGDFQVLRSATLTLNKTRR